MPVLIGTENQRLWQDLAEQAELATLARIPEVADGVTSQKPELPASWRTLDSESLLLLLVATEGLSERLEDRHWPLRSVLFRALSARERSGVEALIVLVGGSGASNELMGELIATGFQVLNAAEPAMVREAVATILSPEQGGGGSATQVASKQTAESVRTTQRTQRPPATPPLKPSQTAPTRNLAGSKVPRDEGSAVEEDSQGEGVHGFDELSESEFSSTAWRILQVARRIGTGQPWPNVASVRRLLASILLSGTSRKDLPNSGAWLIELSGRTGSVIRKQLADRYLVIRAHKGSFDSIVSSEDGAAVKMTAGLHGVIELARRLAEPVRSPGGRSQRVGAHHLLGAALGRVDQSLQAARLLSDFGLESARARNALINVLSSWDVPDDPEVWRGLLDPLPEVSARLTVPTYASDTLAGPDWIGITREVEAMASLVSAWSVEPPLSIGLFGEWGSGKSFFMQKMKERVRQISQEARKSGAGQKEFGYYKNIVQVEFNAWHYAEGNLWASLVEHIFANLRLEGTDYKEVDSEENIKKRLERMLDGVREKTEEARLLDEKTAQLKEEAEKRQREAEQEASKLRDEATAANAQATDADKEQAEAHRLAEVAQRQAEAKADERRKIGAGDLLLEIKDSKELRDQVSQALEKIGITGERLQTLEELRAVLREASDSGRVLVRGIDLFRKDEQRWRLLAWALVVPVLIASGTFWLGWLTSQQNQPWFQTLVGSLSALSAVPTLLISGWRKYRPKLDAAVKVVEDLREKRAELELRVEAARRKRSELAAQLDQEAEAKKLVAEHHRQRASEKLQQAETARRAAAAKEAEAAATSLKADKARTEAEELRKAAEELRPERRIATFIQDRAAAQDYRQHLGVHTIIRRDFEKLAQMFDSQRKAEAEGKDGLVGDDKPHRNDPSIVNRIILYIDDLDRCEPKKVTEVLQAIHLMLAFPLFVVVVAVDARWMKRSLRHQFKLMLAGEDADGNGAQQPSNGTGFHAGGMATPDDYLEKIFQVPFWIRSLGLSSSQNLVRQLTRNDVSAEPAEPSGATRAATEEQRTRPPVAEDPAGPSRSGDVGAPSPSTAPPATNGGATPVPTPSATDFHWSPVEPRPRTLQLSPHEREYMISIAGVIGRSPRSIKRFVNCYRLAKLTFAPDDLARQARDGTFRAAMLLLAIVTGMPEIAPELISDLRSADRTSSPAAWARGVSKKQLLAGRGRWGELLGVFQDLEKAGVRTVAPLADFADHTDRFSFNPLRSMQSGGTSRGAAPVAP